jgi:5'(3')-deoxyribonucleotidase
MINQVLLDMDGVLADFVGGCAKAHKRESPYAHGMGRGVWDMAQLWKISDEEFWAPTNSRDFWLGLEKTAEADAFVEAANKLVGVENVAILSSPSDFEGCVGAKREWLNRHFPQFDNGKRMIFAYSKGFIAGPHRLLVDDRDKNIVEFRKAGGMAILVPRHWNRGHVVAHRAAEIVLADLVPNNAEEAKK